MCFFIKFKSLFFFEFFALKFGFQVDEKYKNGLISS